MPPVARRLAVNSLAGSNSGRAAGARPVLRVCREENHLNVFEAPYQIDGEFVVPRAGAAGGWNPQLQSGHVLSPLLAHLVERVPTLTPMLTTRCFVDLTRPIPLKPLRWRSEIVRQGKKLQVVRASLHDGDVEVCSLTALRARTAASPTGPLRNYFRPDEAERHPGGAFYVTGHELRVREPVYQGNGRATLWSRMERDVIEGVASTPFMHAMSLADFGSGAANVLTFDDWNFPNIDIVVLFLRPPEGDWLLIDAETEMAGNGLGVVSGVLADANGAFARSHQTLFVDPVGPR